MANKSNLLESLNSIPDWIDLRDWEKEEIENLFLPESGLFIECYPDIELIGLD